MDESLQLWDNPPEFTWAQADASTNTVRITTNEDTAVADLPVASQTLLELLIPNLPERFLVPSLVYDEIARSRNATALWQFTRTSGTVEQRCVIPFDGLWGGELVLREIIEEWLLARLCSHHWDWKRADLGKMRSALQRDGAAIATPIPGIRLPRTDGMKSSLQRMIYEGISYITQDLLARRRAAFDGRIHRV